MAEVSKKMGKNHHFLNVNLRYQRGLKIIFFNIFRFIKSQSMDT